MTIGPVFSRSSELRGKFSIQMVRMFTLCSPALFYLDNFTVDDHPAPKEEEEEEEEEEGNINAIQDQCDDHRDKDENIRLPKSLIKRPQHPGLIRNGKEEGNVLLRINLPSDALWAFEDHGLITAESIEFILTTAARPNTLLYYMHVKFLSGLKTIGPMTILAFIGRYYCLRNRMEQKNDAIVSLGKDPRKWSVDVRNDMRSVLGSDISTIVTNLTKLI